MLCFDMLVLKMSFDKGIAVVFVDCSRWLTDTRANMMFRLE
jgi:hypothetical protein